MLARRDVLAGLLFIGVAILGLWLSRDYPIGTALRMGTGYVPRLLCWILLGLGAVVLVQGLREAQDVRPLSSTAGRFGRRTVGFFGFLGMRKASTYTAGSLPFTHGPASDWCAGG